MRLEPAALPIMSTLVVESPSGRCSRMPPSEPHWEELTWSWAWSTGRPTSDQKLEPAAKAAWSYALLCAWVYLNDRDYAHDLMDHAVQNAADYLDRHPESPDWKLVARIKSMLRRRAKQVAHRRRLESPSGSLFDLEGLLIEPSDLEQRSIAGELVDRLSPAVQSVHSQRYLGTPGGRLRPSWSWITPSFAAHIFGS